MTTRRKWLIGGGLGLAGLIALAVLRGPAAIEVETGIVRTDTVRVTVEDEGVTRAIDRYLIASPVAGRLDRLAIREGDAVTEDQIVARLFPVPEDSRVLSAARATLTAAQARRAEIAAGVTEAEGQHQQADREAERRRKLADAGALSRESVEQAELAASSARQRLDAARSALVAADADVDAALARLMGADAGSRGGQPVLVRTPVAGRVLRVLERSERVVPPGSPLIEIADAQGLEVVVDVLSVDAVQVEAGDPIVITGWGGEETIEGVVRVVEPDAFTHISTLGVEEQRVNIVGDLNRAPATLGTGYRVQATIETDRADDVLAVPTSALFRSGTAWRVFAVVNGRATLRDVRIGRRGSTSAEVMSGLDAGETVILFPSDQIADGVKVRASAG